MQVDPDSSGLVVVLEDLQIDPEYGNLALEIPSIICQLVNSASPICQHEIPLTQSVDRALAPSSWTTQVKRYMTISVAIQTQNCG